MAEEDDMTFSQIRYRPKRGKIGPFKGLALSVEFHEIYQSNIRLTHEGSRELFLRLRGPLAETLFADSLISTVDITRLRID